MDVDEGPLRVLDHVGLDLRCSRVLEIDLTFRNAATSKVDTLGEPGNLGQRSGIGENPVVAVELVAKLVFHLHGLGLELPLRKVGGKYTCLLELSFKFRRVREADGKVLEALRLVRGSPRPRPRAVAPLASRLGQVRE